MASKPRQMIDGSDNVTPISIPRIIQSLNKVAGPTSGNVNIDFGPGDVTDPDDCGGTVLCEPNQNYMAIISKQANFFSQTVFNILMGISLDGVSKAANPYKAGILTGSLFYFFKFDANQNNIRFRFLALTGTDIVSVTLCKLG